MKNKIRLYHFHMQDRSDRVRWLLEEMQVPYENVLLDKSKGELQSSDYLKLNPMGRVPTIVDGETCVFESVGICMYLADKYSYGKLAPKIDSIERAYYNQWMVWSVGSLECVVARMFTHVNSPEEKNVTHNFVKEQSVILKKALITTLSQNEYLLSSGFSATDIVVGAILPGAYEYLVEGNPLIENYMQKLMKREAANRSKVFGD